MKAWLRQRWINARASFIDTILSTPAGLVSAVIWYLAAILFVWPDQPGVCAIFAVWMGGQRAGQGFERRQAARRAQ
jgi:hypothetical protein